MRSQPRLLFGHDKDVAEWVESRLAPAGLGHAPRGEFSTIAVFDEARGKVLAGVCYHFFETHDDGTKSMAMTIAADSPMFATRGTIKALLHYPFEQLGCFKVWATTIHTNERAQRFLKGVGFVREGILRHQFGYKRHAAFWGLTKPEYLSRYGK